MAQIQPKKPGRKGARYAIPAAIATVAAATVGLVPALASAGSPDLPKISANRLLAKMAASDTQHMSGTMRVRTDLGLPQMPGAGNGGGQQGGGLFGGGPRDGGHGGKGGKGVATPQDKLMELSSGEHTLRVATDGPAKQRVSIVEDAAEYSFIHNGGEVWTYDSGSDSAFHATAPKGALKHHREHSGKFGKGLRNVSGASSWPARPCVMQPATVTRHATCAAPLEDRGDDLGVVERRRGVRHRDDCGEPAERRGARAGLDRLGLLACPAPGSAPGCRPARARRRSPRRRAPARRRARRGPGATSTIMPVAHQHVGDALAALVEHTTAADEEQVGQFLPSGADQGPQHGHPDHDAVGDLLPHERAGAVDHLGRDLRTADHRSRVHDERVGLHPRRTRSAVSP